MSVCDKQDSKLSLNSPIALAVYTISQLHPNNY